MTGRAVAPLLA